MLVNESFMVQRQQINVQNYLHDLLFVVDVALATCLVLKIGLSSASGESIPSVIFGAVGWGPVI